MRITQGCFSFLPDLTDEQISAQVQYCLDKGWAVNIEFTDDPHPRNTYWEMWGLPMFDLRDAAGIMKELADCRRVYGDRYIRISGFDSSHGWESVRISFIVNRPREEPGFRLDRQESVGRNIRYATHAYAATRPEGSATPTSDRVRLKPGGLLPRPSWSGCTSPSSLPRGDGAFDTRGR